MTAPGITFRRFPDANEDRLDLPSGAGYAAATDQGRQVWILELWVAPGRRGRGCGTALLDAVIARYPGRVLALSAEPFGTAGDGAAGLPAAGLAAWYARHGFRRDQGQGLAGHVMTRPPAPRPG